MCRAFPLTIYQAAGLLQERLNQLQQVWTRVQGYPVHEIIIELALIWVIVFLVYRFLRTTRGARVIQGFVFMMLAATALVLIITSDHEFERLAFLFNQFVPFMALTLVIVFQAEIRRGLVRLGESRIFIGNKESTSRMVEEIVGAVSYLSKNKIGALIAIERQVGLEGVVEAGTRLDAEVSRELLNSVFWPGGALHDMAVLVRDNRVHAAGVQLPLAEGEQISSDLGSRHRAAIGLTQQSDALVVVVSEETGTISVAERGQLTRGLTLEELKVSLVRGLGVNTGAEPQAGPA
jgi:diadenylate cyclase